MHCRKLTSKYLKLNCSPPSIYSSAFIPLSMIKYSTRQNRFCLAGLFHSSSPMPNVSREVSLNSTSNFQPHCQIQSFMIFYPNRIHTFPASNLTLSRPRMSRHRLLGNGKDTGPEVGALFLLCRELLGSQCGQKGSAEHRFGWRGDRNRHVTRALQLFANFCSFYFE